ncbi:MAG: hypothetical protein MSA33_01430 [Campylobacter sp.]|uniref:hypothetical protein n=1 Tax=Campylobacter sp. TaxID=205 RepID=UPI002AA6B33C|nr:hypothetical protein [Campylobacter sp.]MCI7549103.1 hypothetical protein [Campylobacter sp.]
MTSNGIFQQPLLVLLGEILPQNILKNLKKNKSSYFSRKILFKASSNLLVSMFKFVDKISAKFLAIEQNSLPVALSNSFKTALISFCFFMKLIL